MNEYQTKTEFRLRSKFARREPHTGTTYQNSISAPLTYVFAPRPTQTNNLNSGLLICTCSPSPPDHLFSCLTLSYRMRYRSPREIDVEHQKLFDVSDLPEEDQKWQTYRTYQDMHAQRISETASSFPCETSTVQNDHVTAIKIKMHNENDEMKLQNEDYLICTLYRNKCTMEVNDWRMCFVSFV